MSRKDTNGGKGEPKGLPAPKETGNKNAEGLLMSILLALSAFVGGKATKWPAIPKGPLRDAFENVKKAINGLLSKVSDIEDAKEVWRQKAMAQEEELKRLREASSRTTMFDALRCVATFAEKWSLDGSSDFIRTLSVKHGSSSTSAMYFMMQARGLVASFPTKERFDAFLEEVMQGAPTDARWIENGGCKPHLPFPRVRLLFVEREGPK